MREELHNQLVADDANRVPFSFKRSHGANKRNASGPVAAPFPEWVKQ